ncbi:PDC sensor domain-containing protein [Algoriphagus zhangzhouensis]|uniref:Cache domain-containing protein n=1 Tax=Algoriphagus zhangzhouensis TaxID=1073327 RepID=A0A1M7Z4I8_9BACT|nr:PDC sensor domain-containing protein [Algoriphagus zhangzhouensis]TDY48637.1 hypothetical protein A8938_0322 [Algoriphagus zhangzhouensis]SHO59722.1 hypothetical protein SAMN04488108_0322 [Algoriphagus zhangzhouensis]
MKPGLIPFIIFLLLIFSCSEDKTHSLSEDKEKLTVLISSIEKQGNVLMEEMDLLADFYDSLVLNKENILQKITKDKYQFSGVYSNNTPDSDSLLSSVIILTTTPDFNKARDEVRYTNGLDSAFADLYYKYDLITQLYSNSASQISRVFPAYDVANILDPDLDVTAFNFFYEADLEHNPSKGSKWILDPYVDPAGKGWILSLVHPIYDQDFLSAVVGLDITIDNFIQEFLEDLNGDYLIVTGKGDIVGGNATAIEALSMPPLKNHVYRETIQSDNFRISDFNLFSSKSKEVRAMAKAFLLENQDNFEFIEEGFLTNAMCMRFSLIDWYAIKINFDN